MLDIEKEYKCLDNRDLADDFKHFFIEKDDGTFMLSKDVKVDPREVLKFIKHIDDETDEFALKKKKKFRSLIRDNAMKEVCLS